MIRFPVVARLGNVAVIATLLLAIVLASFGAALAQSRRAASEAEFPLVGDEGQRLPNHTVRLLGPIDRLPGVVVVGNPRGKETLIEFYDLNCPFCRAAAADLGEMLKHDQQLRLVLSENGVAAPFANAVIPTGSTGEVALATPSAEQSGLKLQTGMDVVANQTADFVIDFDACKSIVSTGGGKYLLKPVLTLARRSS